MTSDARARFSQTSRSDKATVERSVPVETPVALEFNGVGYAVMMCTPDNLKEFAIGFSLSEQIIENRQEIQDITIFKSDSGLVLRVTIPSPLMSRVLARIRIRTADGACGICGLESLEQVRRPLPSVASHLKVSPGSIFAAIDALPQHQPLNALTGGVHAAAFCAQDGRILLCREDVGRHNALDKLVGALVMSSFSPSKGFILMSSRCSYEIVEKTVIAGCPVLVTISTATSLALERAREFGLHLHVLARSDAFLTNLAQ